MTQFEDAELIAEFAIESQEGLANIEQQMLAIEAAGADVDVDLVNAVFRTMHSIKGTAGFFGLDQIGTLAHGLEEVLNRMRNREIVPSSDLVTTVLQAADYMKSLIETVESSNEADITAHLASLQQFRPGTELATSAPPAQMLIKDVESEPSPAPAMAVPMFDALREFVVECHENLDQMDHDLLAMERDPTSIGLLRGIFRTMHTIKGGAGFLGLCAIEKLGHTSENLLSKLRDGVLPLTSDVVTALLSTVEKCREGLRLLETQGSDAGFDPTSVVEQLLAAEQSATQQIASPIAPTSFSKNDHPSVATLPNLPVVQPPPTSVIKPATGTNDATRDVAAPDKTTVPAGESTIRVDVALLDKLMTRVGELVLARNQIVQFTSRLEDAGFISTAQRLNLITTELQESVMKTRMQPIGNVWSKFPRVIRDLAPQLGKQVRIDMEGEDTELDKTIVEAIKDPLTHVVRNSVDHGIELPDVRQAAGKPAEGTLFLRAFHEGGQVNIEISDDGAGLNIDRIRRKAVERGIVNVDQAARMTEREVSHLVLLPGFSTAESVTSVSGRGVGMDVVITNIERIGGTLDLENRPGKGLTVKIKIPLTLAIIPALVVTNNGDRYAIPQVNLQELVRLEGEEAQRGVEFIHGAPVYRLRGKLLPLVDLSERLGFPKSSAIAKNEATLSYADKVVNIVVLRANDRQFGLIVDRVNDTEEIVVKPLSRQFKGMREYAGVTIMGDGKIALILDVMGFAMAAGLAGDLRDQSIFSGTSNETKIEQTTVTLLVVDLGDTRRFALPTSMVSRLEKVPRSAIEYADGHEVIQYRGMILPILRLGDILGVTTQGESESQDLQIIVYVEHGRSCGLVVSRIADIVETELRLPSTKDDHSHLLGTTVIQDRVTDVLNLRNLTRNQQR